MNKRITCLNVPLMLCAAVLMQGCMEPRAESAPSSSQNSTVHSRCKGTYPGSECQRIEDQLARETPEAAEARRKKLEDERARNMALANAQVTLPVQEQPAQRWFTPDVNFSHCRPSRSPADRLRMIRSFGKDARAVDLPNGVVEVIEQSSAFTEEVWTYYPDERTCVAALPNSQRIPSRYE
jgi:hypothetical protein